MRKLFSSVGRFGGIQLVYAGHLWAFLTEKDSGVVYFFSIWTGSWDCMFVCCVCVYAHTGVRACVRVVVRACVRACVCTFMRSCVAPCVHACVRIMEKTQILVY